MFIRRVALLVEAYDQPGWIYDLIGAIVKSPHLTLAAVLVAQQRTDGAAGIRYGGPVLRSVANLERRALPDRQRALLACRDLRSLARDGGTMVALWPQEDVREALRGLDLDLIIAPDGLPVPREALAGLSRLGVWCLAFCSTVAGSGSYAGFWEVLRRADHTEETLWRLAERREDDELIERRSFNTEVFWLKNQARAFDLAKLMLCDALGRLAETVPDADPDSMPRIDTALPDDSPRQWDGVTYMARQTWLAAMLLTRRLMNRNVRWRIGMFPSVRSQAVASEALVLTPPKGRFFADPFVHLRDNHPYIFFEDYDFQERKGRIGAATFRDGKFELLGNVLNLPYHLSFPYIFEYEGNTYMVPETCGNRTIELWRCVEFPLKWELDRTLMKDISAVDTIIFPYGEYWWLFTNIDRTEGQNHCDELFAFHASSPTSTEWVPHARNPIVNSPAKARNAGMVVSGIGDVVRCAQYQGFCQYGKGVSLNRIEKLTPFEYQEADGAVHYARFLRKNHASMHHWHSRGGHTVFDFAYVE